MKKACKIITLNLVLVFVITGCNNEDNCVYTNSVQSFEVNENAAAGTVLGALNTQAGNGLPVAHKIVAGNEGNVFDINSATGELTVSGDGVLDYETIRGYRLTIETQLSDCSAPVTHEVSVEIQNQQDLPYVDEYFSVSKSDLTTYSDVEPSDQKMFIYTPNDDKTTSRPLFVYAGGGAFGGSNLDFLEPLATRMAKAGYVVATIGYHSDRYLQEDSDPRVRFIKANLDIKAALRYFGKDAREENRYLVDTTNMFIGGFGTGAFLAIANNFMDDSDLDDESRQLLDEYGGFEGNRGNPGYYSEFKAAAALSGGAYDPLIIDAGEKPIVLIHGDRDREVDCLESFTSMGTKEYGSCSLAERASSLDLDYSLVMVPNGDHDAPKNYLPGFEEVLIKFEKYIVK